MQHHQLTPEQARAALETVDDSRLRVIQEIDLPRWYWCALAICWVALGVIADLQHPWLTAAATGLFGVVHAAVAPRVIDGRHRTRQLRVSCEVAGRQIELVVIGCLLGLTGITIGGALAASADGAGHPVTIASLFVAVLILLGGPHVLAAVRRRAAHRAGR